MSSSTKTRARSRPRGSGRESIGGTLRTASGGWIEPLAVSLSTAAVHTYLLGVRFRSGSFEKYVDAARLLREGNLPAERLVDFSPFYLLFHRIAAAVFSRPDAVIVGLQIVAVATAAGLLDRTLQGVVEARWVRWLAVAAFVLDPSLLVYTAILEPEALLVSLIIVLLWVFPRAHVGATAPSRWLLAGLVVAPLLLLRPTLISALLFGTIAAWVAPRGGSGDRSPDPTSTLRQRWRLAWRFAVPGLTVLGLLALRNFASIGELTTQVMNPGTVFFEGNNPVSWGSSATYPPAIYDIDPGLYEGQPDYPHVVYRELARASTGGELGVGEVNRFWRNKTLDYLRSEPQEILRLTTVKLDAVSRNHPNDDVALAALRREELAHTPMPVFPWSVLMVSAWWGMWSQRRAWRRWLLHYGLALTQVAAMVLFYVSARQRLSLLPVAVLFAAMGWDRLRKAPPGPDRRALVIGALVLASLLLLPSPEHLRDRRHLVLARERALPLATQATMQRDADNLGRAAELAALALAEAPTEIDRIRPLDLAFPDGFASTALALGEVGGDETTPRKSPERRFDEVWLRQIAGDLSEAREGWEALRAERSRFDRGGLQSSEPDYYLALLELERGERRAAIERLTALLARRPGEPFVLALLSVLAPEAGTEAKLDRWYDAISRDLLVGEAHCGWGDRAEGRRRLATVVKRMPRLRHAWIEKALCYDAGTLEESRQDYRHAMILLAEPVPRESRVIPLFERVAADRPTERLFQARVLRQYGRLRDALAVLAETRPVPDDLRGAYQLSADWLVARLEENRPDASATSPRP